MQEGGESQEQKASSSTTVNTERINWRDETTTRFRMRFGGRMFEEGELSFSFSICLTCLFLWNISDYFLDFLF